MAGIKKKSWCCAVHGRRMQYQWSAKHEGAMGALVDS